MQKWLWRAIFTCLGAMIAIPLLKDSFWGWFGAIAMTIMALGTAAMAIVKAVQYAHKWGASGLSTTIMIISGFMVLGVAAAWIFRSAFKEFFDKVADKLGIGKGTTGEDVLVDSPVENVTGVDQSDAMNLNQFGGNDINHLT